MTLSRRQGVKLPEEIFFAEGRFVKKGEVNCVRVLKEFPRACENRKRGSSGVARGTDDRAGPANRPEKGGGRRTTFPF